MNIKKCSYIDREEFFSSSDLIENYICDNTDIKWGSNKYFDYDSLTLIHIHKIINLIVQAIDNDYFDDEQLSEEVGPFLHEIRKLPNNTMVNLEYK